MSTKTLSVIAFVFLAVAAIALLRSDSLLADGPAAIGLQLGAVLLMLWARVTFGRRSFHAAANPTEGDLVTNGPYRYIRHPIYSAVLFFLFAGIFSHWSWSNGGIGVIALAAVFIRVLSEEKLLKLRYPEYGEYARRTKRLIPFLY